MLPADGRSPAQSDFEVEPGRFPPLPPASRLCAGGALSVLRVSRPTAPRAGVGLPASSVTACTASRWNGPLPADLRSPGV